jgi:hypothetical protein
MESTTSGGTSPTPGFTPVEPPAPTPTTKAGAVKTVVNENKPKTIAPIEDPIDALKKSGFQTKEEVLSFLKAIDREKTMQAVKLKEMDANEKRIAHLQLLLDQRERDMAAKGDEIQAKLVEYKELFGRNHELVKKLSSLNLK